MSFAKGKSPDRLSSMLAWQWRKGATSHRQYDDQTRTKGSLLACVLPIIVGVVLLCAGHPKVGAFVLCVGVGTLCCFLLRPEWLQRFLALLTRTGVILGEAVSKLGLIAFFFLGLWPLGIILRTFSSQLHSGHSWQKRHLVSSTWEAVPREAPREERYPFSLASRGAYAATTCGGMRLKRFVIAAYLGISAVVCLDCGIGLLHRRYRFWKADTYVDERVDVSSMRQYPWRYGYWKEWWESTTEGYVPYVGYRRLDYKGTYINVRNGRRASYQQQSSTLKQLQKPLRLYMYGGSTTWGTSARDEFTIPSLLAKRAEQDAIPLVVENFGEDSYYTWQNAVEMAEWCAGGKQPDIAIVYQGANDVGTRIEMPAIERGIEYYSYFKYRIEQTSYTPFVWNWYQQTSIIFRLFNPAPSPWDFDPVGIYDYNGTELAALAQSIAKVYRENSTFMSGIGRTYGFPVFHFLQPVVNSRATLFGDEQKFTNFFGGKIGETYVQFQRAVQGAKDPNIIDLTRVFDTTPEPVFTDWYHVSERGNEILADAIYTAIKPTLEQKRAEGARL